MKKEHHENKDKLLEIKITAETKNSKKDWKIKLKKPLRRYNKVFKNRKCEKRKLKN